ncbi:DUF4349 domain-containing protein [Nocardioides ginsengisoli]|uniref:DUF4349 domain-containing protein n=1 Tax=Nocardioides ginsengisoli TaxID=363868 RepID=A0ABW3VU34_9ACTN
MKPTPHPVRTRLSLAVAGLASLVALAACASGGSASDAASKRAAEPASAPAAAKGGPAGALSYQKDASVQDSGQGSVQDSVQDSVKQDAAADDAIISTGSVSLEATDVATARLDVRKIVDRFHGRVTEQETTTGDKGELSTARMVLRVPSASFDEAVAALEGVATLTDSSTSSENVQAEVVDIAARVRAQRASVDRIEALLARAQTIQEIVAIEAQLASRQSDLDALVARQRYLADQTSESTINVYVEHAAAHHAKPKKARTGFLGGLEKGWDSFADGLGGAALVLGFALPWLALGALVGTPIWLAVRRRRRNAPAPAAAAAP